MALNASFWFAVSVVIVLLALGIFVFAYWFRGSREKAVTKREYRVFFYLGVAYIIIGAVLSFVYPGRFSDYFFLMLMGGIFISVYLSNLERWREK